MKCCLIVIKFQFETKRVEKYGEINKYDTGAVHYSY